jgi:hypothetical protein
MSVARDRRKRRSHGGGSDFDGVPDESIYDRDQWECRMPACLHPEGRAIDPALKGAGWHPWRPSIDHVVPLADGGPDTEPNKRAAHSKCNDDADGLRRADRERETADLRQKDIVDDLPRLVREWRAKR